MQGGMGPPPVDPKSKVFPPALTILIMAGITILARVVMLGVNVFLLSMIDAPPEEMVTVVVGMAANVVALLLNIATVVGAYKMMQLQTYSAAMMAAVISVIPFCSPCGILGIPFGIWAIVVLNDPIVKRSFRN